MYGRCIDWYSGHCEEEELIGGTNLSSIVSSGARGCARFLEDVTKDKILFSGCYPFDPSRREKAGDKRGSPW